MTAKNRLHHSSFQHLSNSECFAVRASEVQKNTRLESCFYASSGYRSLQALERSGFGLVELGSRSDVVQPSIFKRCFVEDATAGVPYLNGIQLMELKPTVDRYLSRSNTATLNELTVRTGMAIILDAGQNAGDTIVYVNPAIDGFVTTNNTIRITGADSLSTEYLFVFLNSPVGNYLLTRNKYGTSVPHIDPKHVEQIQLPLLPSALRNEITRIVKEVSQLRTEAHQLHDHSLEEVLRQNYIDVQALQRTQCRSFVASSQALAQGRLDEGYSRLDARYYGPFAAAIRNAIGKSASSGPIRDHGVNVTLLGKTFIPGVHKVDEEFGMPYFTGKELYRTRLRPSAFIFSENKKHLAKLSVRRRTTLLSCAGNVGRAAYVYGPLIDSAITHDAMRVVTDSSIHPGYLFAFFDSILGRAQLLRCVYGSIVPRLHSDHVNGVLMPVPSDNGDSIGRVIDDAFDKREQAIRLEHEAIRLFSDAIARGRELTEAEWGSEY